MGKDKADNTRRSFHVKNEAARFKKFKPSAKNVGEVELSCSDSLNAYEKSRIKDIDGFKSIKAPDGSTITEKLNAADANRVKTQIEEALQPEPMMMPPKPNITAREYFNRGVAGLKKMISEEKPTPGDVASALLGLKSDVVAAINAQHGQAKAKLDNLFADTNFQTSLDAALGAQSSAIRGEMSAALDNAKKEELKKLEESIQANVKQLMNQQTQHHKEFDRIIWLAKMRELDEAMRDEINSQIEASDEGASISANLDEGSAILKNVDVNKLKTFHSIQGGGLLFGKVITKTGENTFSMQLNRLFQTDDSILRDLTTLAQTIKACGHDKITLKISNKDPERALEHARLAYESAIDAGWDPKDITIEVNGETKMKYNHKESKLDEKSTLFRGYEKKLQFLNDKAARIAEERKTYLGGSEESTKQFKERLQAIISQEPAVPAPGGGGPGI